MIIEPVDLKVAPRIVGAIPAKSLKNSRHPVTVGLGAAKLFSEKLFYLRNVLLDVSEHIEEQTQCAIKHDVENLREHSAGPWINVGQCLAGHEESQAYRPKSAANSFVCFIAAHV